MEERRPGEGNLENKSINFLNVVCGNAGNADLETDSREWEASLAYCVDNTMSRNLSYKLEPLPDLLLNEIRDPTGSMNRAWNRLRKGGSRGYPGYGGTGAAIATTRKFL